MDSKQVEIEVHSTLRDLSAEEWDACADPEHTFGVRNSNPFVTHRFLSALEESGSVGPGTGWHPRYLTVRGEDGIAAAVPLYVKEHSQGEYVFDHNWAHAYEQAGGRYYPKLQSAVPFTPVTGSRFLGRKEWQGNAQAALTQAMVQIADDNSLSSAHITFCTAEEAEIGKQLGLSHRTGQQFHWLNEHYGDFDDFLAKLSSRKRKNIRKERARAQQFGGDIVALTGNDIQPQHWDAMWQFYQDTGARKWGTPYLTRAFFDVVHDTMRDDVLLVLAIRDGLPVAGAMNFIGRDALFGRYWGCVEDHPCLHFELCYYQAMDWAISNGLASVEAGAQGEHKLARGYLPVTTHSLHWIRDAGFREAVDKFLVAERQSVSQDVEVLTAWGPFKKTTEEDQQ
ncbi:GNAT family N-acetyltransferase [Shimia sp. MMG029]|uniref:GNAT family N-acetyltransferase n=1 Tax=Shimia sp. MMG029 TaxID=3021978 RepID=UPI0022FEC71B|nr:GNAT family N-acetyltransferase [Shimia sp. MMG029]MDA5556512.1 GNAT family N-acetyltransferase [Shimia sp. MMG029]